LLWLQQHRQNAQQPALFPVQRDRSPELLVLPVWQSPVPPMLRHRPEVTFKRSLAVHGEGRGGGFPIAIVARLPSGGRGTAHHGQQSVDQRPIQRKYAGGFGSSNRTRESLMANAQKWFPSGL